MQEQKFTSAKTSRAQIAQTFKLVPFKKTDRVLDYGGGKYDITAEYMQDKVADFGVYDKYNRDEEHNKRVLARLASPNVITVNNVLNVIAEDEIISAIIEDVYNRLAKSGTAYFLVYEGNRTGKGTPTRDGYQRNQPTNDYIAEISKVFSKVSRQGKLIVANK